MYPSPRGKGPATREGQTRGLDLYVFGGRPSRRRAITIVLLWRSSPDANRASESGLCEQDRFEAHSEDLRP